MDGGFGADGGFGFEGVAVPLMGLFGMGQSRTEFPNQTDAWADTSVAKMQAFQFELAELNQRWQQAAQQSLAVDAPQVQRLAAKFVQILYGFRPIAQRYRTRSEFRAYVISVAEQAAVQESGAQLFGSEPVASYASKVLHHYAQQQL